MTVFLLNKRNSWPPQPTECEKNIKKRQASLHVAADRPEVQPPGPASQTYTSGRSEVQLPDPTGQTATDLKKRATSLTGPGAPAEEPVSDGDQFSDHVSASPVDEEGEVSDLDSASPDREELLNTDQELSAEHTYRETIRGVRSFLGWSQVLEFDSASSSLDDNPFADTRTQHTGKGSVKIPVDDWLCRKFENLTVEEGYPSCSSENAGMNRDQFRKPPKTLTWY